MKIGDTVYVHGYIDEIRKDIIIIKNKGGYFGTAKSEIIISAEDIEPVVWCKDCCRQAHCYQTVSHAKLHNSFNEYWSEQIDFCSRGERREE